MTDDEWGFVAPYLAFCRDDARRREYSLSAVFDALRYMAKTGCQKFPPAGATIQRVASLLLHRLIRKGYSVYRSRA